jgi:hypothetical protein
MNFCGNLLTYIDSLAACASASNFASVVDVITVSCLLARQSINPPKSFIANAYKLLQLVLLAIIKLFWPLKRKNN